MTQAKLTRIRVAGFRSLRDVTLEPTPVTVLIGPNGAGKSNLLWALEMTRMLAFEALQLFVSERGGATYLMHYGPRQTPAIDLALEFSTDKAENAYQARLGYGADESLIFLEERAGFRRTQEQPWSWYPLGAGHRESRLGEEAPKHRTPQTVRWLLRQVNFYHFHDTSRRSPLRTRAYNDSADNYLRSDGSNLPAFLLSLREGTDAGSQAAWKRIQGLVRLVAPFIRELSPHVHVRGIDLNWIDDRGETFGPAHMSDGTLRALALITALGQPADRLPLMSCIDEPELGLHPAALELLCSLIRSVTAHRQVIVSTQSPVVLDHFEPDQVVVAERVDSATQLRRLDAGALAAWLEDYSLSELFDKNILGGRP
jgi:predicted ATPase